MNLTNGLFACMAFLTIVSCANTGGIEGRKDDEKQMIAVKNEWLKPYLELKSMKMRKHGDFLQANATIFSKYRKDLRLQYKFSWYDKDGFVLDNDDSAWKSVVLYGNQTADFVGSAKNAKAEEFKIVFRELNQ